MLLNLSAGPIRVGMPFAQAEEALRTIDGYIEPSPHQRRNPRCAHYASQLSIQVSFDKDHVVEAFEVFPPETEVDVTYDGIDVFQSPAADVISLLGSRTRLVIEDEGLSVIAPDLLLTLGRQTLPESEDEGGNFFDSVLVARPGYYDEWILAAKPAYGHGVDP